MKCPKCESDNRKGIRFCEECGAKLELECPDCKAKIPLGKKFCGECGHDLTKPVKAPAIDYSKPQSYTPKFLADKILTTRSSIEGERKLVTVLFADVANYTSISEKLDPEEVHQIMDGCFKILMYEIHKYEGTINQFTGDGVMALFGAPVAHEDHAQRACYAALSIQKALEHYEEKIKKDFGADFKMRIGLNSGPVIVGSIGDDLRMDYTAVGDTSNLASRIESAASPGISLVSKHTHKLSKDFFEFKSLGKVEVKGKEAPQEVFELIKAGEVDTRIAASAAKGLTRFVGRKNSMAAIGDAWNKALAGSGQVLGVVGEAGVGKSRLLLEFRNSLPPGDFTFLEGRCLHYGGSMAYLPFLDILKLYFGIKDGEQEYAITKKMKDKLTELDEELVPTTLSAFQDLLSLKIEDETWLYLDPKEKRTRTFEAIRNLLISVSQKRPLVVSIEDLHWMDKTSEKFLNYFIDWLAKSPILLILLYRPEFTHQWGSKSYYTKIGLSQLTSQSSAELIRAILYDCEIESQLETLIMDRSAGTPLYIEELTFSLLENGSIQRGKNQCYLAKATKDTQVPDTIQGIIAARMDRLEDNLKRTMQVASVIGRDFAFRILQTITRMREELKSYLLNLQGLEFIYEKRLFPELEYTFKHALTQEVAYNSLLLKRRKELHEKIGQAIEQVYPERLEEFYEMLAYHCYEGEDWPKALSYLAKAGDKATGAFANREALDYYARALEVCKKLGASTLSKSVELAKKRGLVNGTIGDFQGAIVDFNRMLTATRSLADQHLEGMAMAYRGWAEHQYYDEDTAEDTLKAALTIANEGFQDVRFFASATLGALYLAYNRHTEAEKLLRTAEELAPEVDDPFILGLWIWYGSLWSYWKGRFDDTLKIQAHWQSTTRRGGVASLMNSWVEALAHGSKGRYGRALSLLEEVLVAGKRMGEPITLVRALNTVGWIYGELQDHSRAMRWNIRGVKAAQEANFSIPEAESNARVNLGDNLLALGRLDEAEGHFQKVEKVVRNPRPQDHNMLWRYSQHLFHSYGKLWLARGDLNRAMAYADECLALAKQSSSEKNMVKGHRLRAQVFLAQGKLEEANQELFIALEVAQQIGNPSQLWKTYAFKGDLRQTQERPDDAYRAYADALAVIEEVVAGLKNMTLRDMFMGSHQVQEIRQKAQRERRKR
jgi:class 3 adenylate cyclase/tetratricopeptide (TPR) repeat protein